MRGLSKRLRFPAAFGWCRNDTRGPQPVGIPIFEGMTPVKFVLRTYLMQNLMCMLAGDGTGTVLLGSINIDHRRPLPYPDHE